MTNISIELHPFWIDKNGNVQGEKLNPKVRQPALPGLEEVAKEFDRKVAMETGELSDLIVGEYFVTMTIRKGDKNA
jgi:hypothetical protein